MLGKNGERTLLSYSLSAANPLIDGAAWFAGPNDEGMATFAILTAEPDTSRSQRRIRMTFHVLGLAINQLKIAYGQVASIFVFVVNYLARIKSPAKMVLHDQPMHPNTFPAQTGSRITAVIEIHRAAIEHGKVSRFFDRLLLLSQKFHAQHFTPTQEVAQT